ncbi:Crp/Fnr family transcriptional regulator [Bacillus sonorensis]|uniref:Transcriptional regulator ArfM n=2 Tax=Bacillus sonorensis TaxID=119858 RepID=M5P6P4_9BACI|nr:MULTISPECIES: Crp/Fnr family transcriptional regulator [Bacillus]TWK84294.1 putative transcription regulator ArfM [Bacillus paralicheniformis]ASB89084.1 putative transcription regulator ArfM [Bacillus sonorensis]EME75691.1 transcriptional regulator ArfM [Bacillus sonorensis L12]MBG9915045.1 transcriptional regulator [Bacillus sonorensis]MCF7618428.1 Crp/Fnr family transcriptional regulator [Bacillus sonorensis]
MDRFDYLIFLKNLPMFLGVPLPIIKRLLKNGKVIDIASSRHTRSFLHSQSVYFVLKGEVLFADKRLPEDSRIIAEWEKGDVFPIDQKGEPFLSPFISVKTAADTTVLEIPFTIFKKMMTYNQQLQMNFLKLLQQNLFFSYQLFLRYLHSSQENAE